MVLLQKQHQQLLKIKMGHLKPKQKQPIMMKMVIQQVPQQMRQQLILMVHQAHQQLIMTKMEIQLTK